MADHTPTPWTTVPGVYDTSPETASEFPHGPEILNAGGSSIAACNFYCEADAAFIVKAVNSHDALVRALQLIAGMSDDIFARNVAENILTARGLPIKEAE